MLKISTINIAFMEWFEGKLISLFRQIFHVECKDIGFSSPIPKPAKREQRCSSALNESIALKTSWTWIFKKRLPHEFFSAQTEIKISGALSKDQYGCRKELKGEKFLNFSNQRFSILTRNEAGNRRKTFSNIESFINWNALNSPSVCLWEERPFRILKVLLVCFFFFPF